MCKIIIKSVNLAYPNFLYSLNAFGSIWFLNKCLKLLQILSFFFFHSPFNDCSNELNVKSCLEILSKHGLQIQATEFLLRCKTQYFFWSCQTDFHMRETFLCINQQSHFKVHNCKCSNYKQKYVVMTFKS